MFDLNIDLFTNLNLEFLAHTAIRKCEKEICGVWTADGALHFLYNFADDPFNSFTFTPSSWNRIELDAQQQPRFIKGIFHSHPSELHSENLSFEDINVAKNTGLDIACFSLQHMVWDYYKPDYPHPYPLKIIQSDIEKIFKFKLNSESWFIQIKKVFTGQEYLLNRSDCYSIVRDFLNINFGITLKEFSRTRRDYAKDRNWNRFSKEYYDCGFVPINTNLLQTGDVLMLNMENSPHPNHIGVYIGLDSGLKCVLHQPGGNKKSEIIAFKSVEGLCTKALRHLDLMGNAVQNVKPVSFVIG